MNLQTFALLPTAESFCRGAASSLQITSLEVVVLECIPQAAQLIRISLEKFEGVKPWGENMPLGSLSPEAQQVQNAGNTANADEIVSVEVSKDEVSVE